MGRNPARARRVAALAVELDALVRAGRGNVVRAALRRLPHGTPRSGKLPLANIARRVGLPELGLRWLRPLVRPSAHSAGGASPAERAEYAACLVRIGAIDEALALLDGMEPAAAPEGLIYRCFGLVARWEYARTIEPLEAYLSLGGGDDYSRLIARCNLAAAYVVERRSGEAERLLEALVGETAAPGLGLLRGNVFELQAQSAIDEGRFGAASLALEKARSCLREFGDLETMFVRKWEAVLALLSAPGSAEAERALAEVRDEAAGRRHWETVRQCDHYRAIARQDRELALRVLAGTPYEAFRERLRRDFAVPLPALESARWGTPGAPVVLDLGDAESVSRAGLKAGQAIHRALLALTADWYRPCRLGTLHSQLYPGQHYRAETSPERVHRVLRRARQWLSARRLPLQIVERDRGYRLVETSPCAVQAPLRLSGETLILRRVRVGFPERPFSVKEADALAGASRRSTQYALQEAVRRGTLERVGRGPATRYRFLAVLLLSLATFLGGCTPASKGDAAKASLVSIGGNGEGIGGENRPASVTCLGAEIPLITIAGDVEAEISFGTLESPRHVPKFAVRREDASRARRYEGREVAFSLVIDETDQDEDGFAAKLTATVDGMGWSKAMRCRYGE